MTMSVVTQTSIIARKCSERAQTFNMKGKKRDDFCIDYFCGAIAAAEASGNEELAKHLNTVGVLIIATRGYQGLLDLLNPRPAFKVA